MKQKAERKKEKKQKERKEERKPQEQKKELFKLTECISSTMRYETQRFLSIIQLASKSSSSSPNGLIKASATYKQTRTLYKGAKTVYRIEFNQVIVKLSASSPNGLIIRKSGNEKQECEIIPQLPITLVVQYGIQCPKEAIF